MKYTALTLSILSVLFSYSSYANDSEPQPLPFGDYVIESTALDSQSALSFCAEVENAVLPGSEVAGSEVASAPKVTRSQFILRVAGPEHSLQASLLIRCVVTHRDERGTTQIMNDYPIFRDAEIGSNVEQTSFDIQPASEKYSARALESEALTEITQLDWIAISHVDLPPTFLWVTWGRPQFTGEIANGDSHPVSARWRPELRAEDRVKFYSAAAEPGPLGIKKFRQ